MQLGSGTQFVYSCWFAQYDSKVISFLLVVVIAPHSSCLCTESLTRPWTDQHIHMKMSNITHQILCPKAKQRIFLSCRLNPTLALAPCKKALLSALDLLCQAHELQTARCFLHPRLLALAQVLVVLVHACEALSLLRHLLAVERTALGLGGSRFPTCYY